MDKLRLIHVGLGGWGEVWLNQYTLRSPHFELAAIVDADANTLARVAKMALIPKEQGYTSFEKALEGVEADAVLLVTPPDLHLPQARIAFEHGMHVLTEKPIAGTLPDGQEMVALAARHKLQLSVSQNYRYRPAIRTMQRMVKEETYGALGHGHIDFYIPIDFGGGFRDHMQYPLLRDMAIHHFDLIRCITGQDIARVFAVSFNPEWSWIAHDPAAKLILELADGTPISYTADWTASGDPTPWNGHWRLQCAEGAIHLTDDRVTVTQCARWGDEALIRRIKPDAVEHTEMNGTLHAFAQAIRSGAPTETSGADNLHSFAAVAAAIHSAEQGCWVTIEEMLNPV